MSFSVCGSSPESTCTTHSLSSLLHSTELRPHLCSSISSLPLTTSCDPPTQPLILTSTDIQTLNPEYSTPLGSSAFLMHHCKESQFPKFIVLTKFLHELESSDPMTLQFRLSIALSNLSPPYNIRSQGYLDQIASDSDSLLHCIRENLWCNNGNDDKSIKAILVFESSPPPTESPSYHEVYSTLFPY